MIFIVLVLLVFSGCQDVIEVEVPNDKPRLSIDALVRVNANEPLAQIKVKATETTSFFEEISPADLSEVYIVNTTDNSQIDLIEEPLGSGIYISEWPINNMLQGELQLTIFFKGEVYTAKTSYVPTVPLDAINQGDGTLFSGEETEVVLSFTDEPNREDFYLFDFDFNEYLVSEDTFYPGQSFEFSYFYEDGLESGRELNISIIGVDEPFYNYMNQLIVQSGGDQGPFQTPSATVKGNIVNTTNADNFALGYFAVCQTYNNIFVIE